MYSNLSNYIKATYPMPQNVKEANAAAITNLYDGPGALEEGQPGWEASLATLRAWCDDLPSTIWRDLCCDFYTDVEPNDIEIDAGADWREYNTREVLAAALGDNELAQYI
jgi:hypothetical protein